MNDERIARISDIICDQCPKDMELIGCAMMVIRAAVNAGIPEADLRKALVELYGE